MAFWLLCALVATRDCRSRGRVAICNMDDVMPVRIHESAAASLAGRPMTRCHRGQTVRLSCLGPQGQVALPDVALGDMHVLPRLGRAGPVLCVSMY